MLDISVWVHGVGSIPAEITALGLGKWHACQQDTQSWEVCVRSPMLAGRDLFDRVVAIIQRESAEVWHSHFVLREPSVFNSGTYNDAFFADPEVVAFTVVCDFLQFCKNPPEDFDVKFPFPCKGLVATDKPIHVDERPQGLISDAGENTIYHSKICAYLVRHIPGASIGPGVVFRAKPLENWHRINASPSLGVLDRSFFEPLVCLRCQSPTLADTGIWFGHKSESLAAGFDVRGWDHKAATLVLVVSPAIAREMSRQFRKGYGLVPVFDGTGPTAAMVREVREQLAPFRGLRKDWTIDPAKELGLAD